MLPTLFLIGLAILLVGVFRKKDTETTDLFKEQWTSTFLLQLKNHIREEFIDVKP